MQRNYYQKLLDDTLKLFPTYSILLTDDSGKPVYQYGSVDFSAVPLIFELANHYRFSVYIPKSDGKFSAYSRAVIEKLILDSSRRERLLSSSTNELKDRLTFLASRLFNQAGMESLTYIDSTAQTAGYDFTLPYRVCLLDLNAKVQNETNRESMARYIIYIIRSFSDTYSHDLVTLSSSNRIVICRQVRYSDESDFRDIMRYLTKITCQIHEKFDVSIRVGVGETTHGITDFNVSLNQARSALKYAGIFNPDEAISFYANYRLEDELARLPDGRLSHFLEPYCLKLDESPQLFELIEALTATDFELKAAAELLYIHRNTAVYRMEQIKDIFSLNPLHNDSDKFTLVSIYIYYRLTRHKKILVYPRKKEKKSGAE